MTINVDGRSKRIGLALSGGGCRAAGFHLGAFRQLESLGLLWKVDLISCVSGGSIAGAFLAANWNRADALDDFESYLATKSIAVKAFLLGLLDPSKSRLDDLADSYDSDLFRGLKLEALSGGPRIYLNATNISTGNRFAFMAGGGAGPEMGEHELGYHDSRSFSVARAVAASSAFPPVFPPLKLTQREFPTSMVEFVSLIDGGVYDNLGVNPLFGSLFDYAIVSDAGKPFEIDETPTRLGTKTVYESIGILMEQVRGLQFDRLKLRHMAATGPKPLWFSIDSERRSTPADAAAASEIATNLKALSRRQLETLARHAASLCKDRLHTFAPELLSAHA